MSRLDSLLDPFKAKTILQEYVGAISDIGGDVLNVEIQPIKMYRDSKSFSLIATYNLEISSPTGTIYKKNIFAAAHSDKSKEVEYQISREIFDSTLETHSQVLRVPKPYCFIKSYNLFLREYVEGQVFNKLIAENKSLSPTVYEQLISAIIEFQGIKVMPLTLKTTEEKPDIETIRKNILILKRKGHPQWRFMNEKFNEIENALTVSSNFTEEKVLSHGDLNPSNIILTSDNKIVFIDFGNVNQRHYLWDVAGLYSHLGTVMKTVNTGFGPEVQQKLFLDAYLKGASRVLDKEDKKLFMVFKGYFDLMILTHLLVWG